jgi:Mg/Co/Ni transporter MgtE
MSRVITASLVFEYVVDNEELMGEMDDDEQIEYVRETTLEDICEMAMRYTESLANAITIEVRKEN